MNLRRRLGLYALASAVIVAHGWSGAALANMSVYPMIISVAGETNAPGRVRVTSKSDATQYVKVSVKRILNPATEHEREEDVTSWSGKDLVVSPTKFALPAGTSRSVRVISMQAPEQEEAYRVLFEGATSLAEEDDSVSKGALKAEVNISLIWGVLVRAEAKNGQPELVRDPSGLRNSGNTRIGLMEVAACGSADAASCKWETINQSIYPGASLALPATTNAPTLRTKFTVGGKPQVHEKQFPAPG